MPTDAFYLENENYNFIKENCKKRGDKSKILNKIIEEHRQKILNKTKREVIVEI